MSRDDLIKTNAKIVKEATEKAIKYSPDAIIIVVSNPLDVMTYAAFQAARKSSNKVFGMAGILDTGRYRAFVADALNVSAKISMPSCWVAMAILWCRCRATPPLTEYL
ncbi:MAG: hypothetical protein U5L09_17515 [Bacteroidales bacterium]|nr:hypothetical protein [Bacteroidales bacterium]